jgi:hypothetical protein
MSFPWYSALAVAMAFGTVSSACADDVTLRAERDHVAIEIGGAPFARYVFHDERIARPFFADVHALNGAAVTRSHPPREGVDATDHATMHPGVWLAFGDIDGADFWRNQGTVRHEGLQGDVEFGPDFGRFRVKNQYLDGEREVCEETRTISIRVRDPGVFMMIDSVFTGDADFAFGDQEEMGLGVRVATPMTVENGGRITNSEGMIDEAGCWGKQARWAEYAGTVDGERVGIVLMPRPENFGLSWFHARDYGLLVANPFGRRAFTGGEPSRTVVKAGESFKLRFGVCVYVGAAAADRAYSTYLGLVDARGEQARN